MSSVQIERTQTGVRIATPLLKVLRALADHRNMTLGDLLEGIVLHAFDSKTPFSKDTLRVIEQLRDVYGLTLTSADAITMKDKGARGR
jgi:predicted DNA-binding ribbon-helix-helix protein